MYTIVWVCWVAEKKNVVIRSFAKIKERLEKEQAVIQAVEKNIHGKQWTRTSCKLLVGSTSTVIWPWNIRLWSMTSMLKVRQTSKILEAGKLCQIHWCWSFPNWTICWWKNGNKEALIYFSNKIPGREIPKTITQLSRQIKRKEGGRYFLVGLIK